VFFFAYFSAAFGANEPRVFLFFGALLWVLCSAQGFGHKTPAQKNIPLEHHRMLEVRPNMEGTT